VRVTAMQGERNTGTSLCSPDKKKVKHGTQSLVTTGRGLKLPTRQGGGGGGSVSDKEPLFTVSIFLIKRDGSWVLSVCCRSVPAVKLCVHKPPHS
jgi:hypothetical protein